MDNLIAFNKNRWEELVREGVLYSRPWLDLTLDRARARVDPLGLLGDLAGRRVLCLAGGGGQQSAAVALLGAHVTVLDLTDGQLARDRQAAAHYNLSVETAQGDMRDLSRFPAAAFDAVYQPYSINFVPDPETVFRQVARVLRPGSPYRVGFHNPFTFEASETDWDGRG